MRFPKSFDRVAWLFLALVLWGGAAWAQYYPGTAARVNGVDISNEIWQRNYREYLIQNNINVVTARNPKRMEELRRQTLDLLIEQELAWQAAQKKRVLVSAAEVDKAVEEVRASFKKTDGFARKLANEGYTEESYREHLRRLLSARKYLDEIGAAKAKVTDAEVKQFYKDNPERLTLPEQVRARYIVLRIPPGATPEERKALRDRMDSIRKSVRNVDDFAAMAKQHSEDGTASAGGDLGAIARGQIEKPAEEVAFVLKPGQVSEVIDTPDTLFLVFVEQHFPKRLLPLAEVRDQLRDYIGKEKAAQAVKDELERLRAAAKVEILATF
jgi:parvulin-like peptidyl-prolyl isomerase